MVRTLGFLAFVATALLGCSVLPAGDLGPQGIVVPMLVEDPVGEAAVVAAAWSTPLGPQFIVCARETAPQGAPLEQLVLYEGPPGAAVRQGVARLDVYLGDPEDVVAVANGRVPNGAVATSRSTIWQADKDLRTLNPEDVPFALAEVPVRPNDDFRTGVVYVDSSDAEARRCGDAAAATCPVDCDIITGDGSASCCMAAHQQFDGCDAVVVEAFYGSVPMRFRNLVTDD